MIKSINYNQTEILRDIITLYVPDDFANDYCGIDVDLTYGCGGFYKNKLVPEPRYKFDLIPLGPGVVAADSKKIQFSPESVRSIIYDPPFTAGRKTGQGLIHQRFTGYRAMDDAWEDYRLTLIDCYRVLRKKGVLIVKIQATVSGGKQWDSPFFIKSVAQQLGMEFLDEFVLLSRGRMVGHNHAIQQHARKFHSYFLVFRK